MAARSARSGWRRKFGLGMEVLNQCLDSGAKQDGGPALRQEGGATAAARVYHPKRNQATSLRMAQATAWVREVRSSLPRIALTCDVTVRRLRNSVSAISRLLSPSVIRRSTSISRGERPCGRSSVPRGAAGFEHRVEGERRGDGILK